MSLSARRAWIEILPCMHCSLRTAVALRKESVDRNARCRCWVLSSAEVALRKESVDRNVVSLNYKEVLYMSLSARRAWIEICPKSAPCEAPTSRSPQGERG